MLERSVVDMIEPDRNVSIEREIWPRLVGNGLLRLPADAYWLDIGTPERYLQGTFDIIEGNVQTDVLARLGAGYLSVDDDAERRRPRDPARRRRARLRDRRRRACRLARRARQRRAGRRGHAHRALGRPAGRRDRRRTASLTDCIVAAGVRIGDGTTVSGGAVLGEGVTVGADNVLTRGVRVFPSTEIPDGAITF